MILLLQLFVRERNILGTRKNVFSTIQTKSAKETNLKQIIVLSKKEKVINNETPLLFKYSTYGIFIVDDAPSLSEMLNKSNLFSWFLTMRQITTQEGTFAIFNTYDFSPLVNGSVSFSFKIKPT